MDINLFLKASVLASLSFQQPIVWSEDNKLTWEGECDGDQQGTQTEETKR